MDQHAGSHGQRCWFWSQYLLLRRLRCILYQLPPLQLAIFWIFMVQGKITEADAPTIRLDATPSELSVPQPPSSPIFTLNALSAASLPIYPGLGQAPNNAGLYISGGAT